MSHYYWLILLPTSETNEAINTVFSPKRLVVQELRDGKINVLLESDVSLSSVSLCKLLKAHACLWVNESLTIGSTIVGGHTDPQSFDTFLDLYAPTYAGRTLEFRVSESL
ncbi:hypothetical protein [Stutzerimonas stutzeri]|uniref:Uncharacterized protein n=1 Tax=Stutzerimonas stutzeri TaxID=316 RepID=A0A0D9ANG3_STUST|nr:hypothetical protein [Stutzerimonas stutzeri]KJH80926.1 hypothetical protein UF78_13885 [Stutzerimonas stutzeri]